MKMVLLISFTALHFGIFSQSDTLTVKPPQLNIPIDSVIIDNETIEFGGPEASFPGGYDSLIIFIEEHFLCFPDSKTEVSSEKIWIRFIVEKNGDLSEISVVKGKHEELFDCYISFIKEMPKWIPACEKKDCYRETITLPINVEY